MKATLFFISDIHLSDVKAENEGLVIKAFLQDVEKQLKTLCPAEVFVVLGGDLVENADRRVSTTLSMTILLNRFCRWVSRRKISSASLATTMRSVRGSRKR